MSSITSINVPQLRRLVGCPDAPLLIDVRKNADFVADPASCRPPAAATQKPWLRGLQMRGKRAVVVCQHGGLAARRSRGLRAPRASRRKC